MLTGSAEPWLAQVYAASIMFGYFVRRVDKRFQLERSLGMLPQNQEEAVARLERLFSQVPPPANHHAAREYEHLFPRTLTYLFLLFRATSATQT